MKHIKLFEGFATNEGRKIDKIVNWLGYDDFEEFIGDNPGCYEVITEWVSNNFSEKLSDIDEDELDKVNIYLDINEKLKNPFKKKKLTKISFPNLGGTTDKRIKYEIIDMTENTLKLKNGNLEMEIDKNGKIIDFKKGNTKMKKHEYVDDITKDEINSIFNV
jgi:hypothetical protein